MFSSFSLQQPPRHE